MSSQRKRTCGNCTACCRPMAVVELFKSVGVWCPHCEQGVGCRVYQNRPLSCGNFQCLWFMGYGKANERPDQVGVLLDLLEVSDDFPEGVLQIWESTKGGLRRDFTRRITIEFLSRDTWVVHRALPGGVSKIFRPKSQKMTPAIREAIGREKFELTRT